MARRLRVLVLAAMAVTAFLAAANIGSAKPVGPSVRQAPACAFIGGAPPTSYPCSMSGQTFNTREELMAFCGTNPAMCMPKGGGGMPPGGDQQQGGGQQQPPGGPPGGVDWKNLADRKSTRLNSSH